MICRRYRPLILVLLRRCVYPFFFLFGLELAGQEML